jgi:hypothetical protein
MPRFSSIMTTKNEANSATALDVVERGLGVALALAQIAISYGDLSTRFGWVEGDFTID